MESQIGNEAKILSYRTPTENPNCFYCKSENVIKFGKYSKENKTRYRCKDCLKTFCDLTGTSVYNVKKKHLWVSFAKMTLENRTIRDTAKRLHLSTATVFSWRHRLLDSLDEIFTREFKGIVETDEVYLNFNQKGRRKQFVRKEKKKRGISRQKVAVMVTADRYKTLDMRNTKLGRINVADLERVIDKKRLNDDNIICSDMHPTIERFVKQLKLKHVQLKSSARHYSKEKIYHVNKVNSLASELKRWLHGNFKNVSTKYLQNYLSLFKVQQILSGDEKLEGLLKYSLKDDTTYSRRKRAEEKYQEFLKY